MQNLTATEAKKAKTTKKTIKISEGGGLCLQVNPNGAKYWRYDYRFAGKRKTLALGVYPKITLKRARERHQEAKALIGQEIDPTERRKIHELTRHIKSANSFELVAVEWYPTQVEDKSDGQKKRTQRPLENDLYQTLGNRPIANITAPELLCSLRKIEGRGAIEMDRRAKQIARIVFRYAIVTGRAEQDPSRDLEGVLKNKLKLILQLSLIPKK